MAEWLDYGTLGLLGIVLVAVGVATREIMRHWQEAQQTSDQFMRDLIAQDRAERKAQLATWQQLVAKDIEAKQALSLAIEALCEQTSQHEERAVDRHEKLLTLIEAERREW